MSVTMTQDELVDELRRRFGDDPLEWAFVCPQCGDVASAADFREALAAHPRTNRDGSPKTASHLLGQECIGRTLGALTDGSNERGCDWCAFGLLPGPLGIEMPDGHIARSFHIAEVAR